MTESEEDPYVEAVRKKAERMSRARQDRRPVWVVLSLVGSIGWQFSLLLVGCTLGGHALGRLIDHDAPTLFGIVLGLVLGIWQAWRSIQSTWED